MEIRAGPVDFEFQFIPELTLVGCALYYSLTTDERVKPIADGLKH